MASNWQQGLDAFEDGDLKVAYTRFVASQHPAALALASGLSRLLDTHGWIDERSRDTGLELETNSGKPVVFVVMLRVGDRVETAARCYVSREGAEAEVERLDAVERDYPQLGDFSAWVEEREVVGPSQALDEVL